MSGAKGKIYPEEFKRSAVELVKTSGQTLSHTARHLGVNQSALYRWVEPYGPAGDAGVSMDLAAEVKPWRGGAVNAGERHFKKSHGAVRSSRLSSYRWIQNHQADYPVDVMCQVLGVSGL